MKQFLTALAVATPALMLSVPAATDPALKSGTALAFPMAQAASSNDALVMLLDQFRDLSEELTALRGQVEEQAYEIRRLQRDSLDRYTDLDSRLTELSGQLNSGAAGTTPQSLQRPPALNGGNNGVNGNRNGATSGNGSGAANTAGAVPGGFQADSSPRQNQAPDRSLTEQQLYQVALDSLLQSQNYQRSISEFDQYLSVYPAGRFVTNAHYWKGQAYLNLSRLEDARDSFEVILNQYPDGRKADDAMYSLATTYDKLGNGSRARELLRSVISKYPNTSAANLADIYLRSLN